MLGRGLRGDGEFADILFEDLGDQFLLVGEAPVDGADADPGAFGHVIEGDLQTVIGEELAGCLDDALLIAGSIGA